MKLRKETLAKPSTIVNWVRDILIAESYLKPYQEPKKPKHGRCCTCQDCGYGKEEWECVCDSNALNKIFDTMTEEADDYFK